MAPTIGTLNDRTNYPFDIRLIYDRPQKSALIDDVVGDDHLLYDIRIGLTRNKPIYAEFLIECFFTLG